MGSLVSLEVHFIKTNRNIKKKNFLTTSFFFQLTVIASVCSIVREMLKKINLSIKFCIIHVVKKNVKISQIVPFETQQTDKSRFFFSSTFLIK